jgi:phosphoribosylanthranilate isomerase
MKVKICGITNHEDALAAVAAGADLLGFNFYPKSPRCIEPKHAARLVESVRAKCAEVQFVGVFVNSSPESVCTIMEMCGLDLAQLCGDEPPATLAALNDYAQGWTAFKALRPKDQADLAQSLLRYPPKSGSPAYLVDAYRPGEYGGTGLTADWTLARSLAEAHPLLLAGGLTPENVAGAIRQVRPWGVDVASGVEDSPGRKNHARMAALIETAKEIRIQ